MNTITNSGLSRRGFFQISAMGAGTILLASCAPTTAGDSSSGNFIVAGNTTPDFTQVPFMIAESKGYLRDAGLTAEWVPMSGGVMPSALLSGGINYAILSAGANITNLRGQGRDVKAFATLSKANSNMVAASKEFLDRVGADPDAPLEQRLLALKGARWAGISAASATTSTIVYLMNQVGLKRDEDYTITYIDSVAGFVSAMQTGQIDAFIANSPGPQQTEANGSGIVYLNLAKDQLPAFEDMTWAVLWGMQHELDARPEIARDLVGAIWEAQKLIAASPEEAKAAVRDNFDIPDDVFELAWRDSLPLYPENPRVLDESFARSLRLFEGRAGVPLEEDLVAARPYFDNRFVEQVMGGE